jgi:general secretion pathway protein F
MSSARVTRPVTLEQLALLNSEIAALTRSGFPLPAGLKDFGRDTGGRVGRLMELIGSRLEQGQALEGILASAELGIPEVYLAVVQAGLRSGRLASALEGVAYALRQLLELRQTLWTAMIYPTCIALLCYAGMIHNAWATIPAMLEIYHDSRVEPIALLDWIDRSLILIQSTAVLLPPLALALLIAFWWRGGKAADYDRVSRSRWPSPRGLRYAAQLSSLAELLALLIGHEVPLPVAITLATQASNDRSIRAWGEEFAASLAQGGNVKTTSNSSWRVPALLRWCLRWSSDKSRLTRSLRSVSLVYRDRSIEMERRLQRLLPLAALIVFGGLTVFAFALSVVLPWAFLMHSLGQSS